jgi:hypothetical protein
MGSELKWILLAVFMLVGGFIMGYFYSEEMRTGPQSGRKIQLSEEDLAEAKKVGICMKRSEYKTIYQAAVMRSISLMPNVLTTGAEGTGSNNWQWIQSPRIFDKGCRELSLKDIRAGDVLNLYVGRSGSGNTLVGIQKISK